ncbi:DUF1667 domain-containing protein [Haloplasma contractile]|uniref:Molybdopterin oxidoreductase 4Fe-4S cluster-binding subunit protein n=1 Tax=Haloplasma contractile SSD-17B TaxID=1033810 RepID=U2FK71_9MOLU|nr:DUF1667 domain-containing protein [Haloplasma contractile]ERJ11629.1 Molybdopterin oxidoreductase 4Fe-4S cluster-binding subunit protein [Haloplasma contractile SSD-17B]
MFKKELTCIVCPRGCKLTVTKENEQDDLAVSGNFCKRGINYGINEILNPTRQVTSTVRINGAVYKRLPVITDKEIVKGDIFKVMEELNKVTVEAPVKYGDIVIKNILNSDVNIIASRSM